MILHFVTAFLLQEINASQEKSQRKSNSPSQTGKVSGLKYLCRTDRVDYSLGFIKGSASKARLCGLPFAKQGNGVDLAPPGEGVRLRISVA